MKPHETRFKVIRPDKTDKTWHSCSLWSMSLPAKFDSLYCTDPRDWSTVCRSPNYTRRDPDSFQFSLLCRILSLHIRFIKASQRNNREMIWILWLHLISLQFTHLRFLISLKMSTEAKDSRMYTLCETIEISSIFLVYWFFCLQCFWNELSCVLVQPPLTNSLKR